MPSICAKRTRRTSAAIMGALAAAIGLTAAACSSSPSPAGSASGASRTHHPTASHSPVHESGAFGSDCGMIPASGMGSLHSMSMDNVVAAASHNPLLATLAADLKTAGLTADLSSMHAVTVFAPSDTAFKMLHGSEMNMLHSKTELAKILKYHVVSGRVTPSELAQGTPLKTLEGATVKPSKMGSVYEVNNAHVICGNIQTANATVYIIDKVLIPMH
jgi:uncharacterized surface protein with fasciclin (FAS1) repeats